MVATLAPAPFIPAITTLDREHTADILGEIATENLDNAMCYDVQFDTGDMVCGRCGDHITDVPELAAIYGGRAVAIANPYALADILGDAAQDHRAECIDPEPYDYDD